MLDRTPYFRQYYLDHKDHMIKYATQLITCECGFVTAHGHLSRHRKSKNHRHLLQLKLKEQEQQHSNNELLKI